MSKSASHWKQKRQYWVAHRTRIGKSQELDRFAQAKGFADWQQMMAELDSRIAQVVRQTLNDAFIVLLKRSLGCVE